jgi:hypothetical protein
VACPRFVGSRRLLRKASSHPISRSGRVACPRSSPKRSLNTLQASPPISRSGRVACPRSSPKRSLNTLQAPLPISRSGRVACPRCLTQSSLKYSASTSPHLKVRKVGLPPLPRPKDPSILCKHHHQSQGQEGWACPRSSPKQVTSYSYCGKFSSPTPSLPSTASRNPLATTNHDPLPRLTRVEVERPEARPWIVLSSG